MQYTSTQTRLVEIRDGLKPAEKQKSDKQLKEDKKYEY